MHPIQQPNQSAINQPGGTPGGGVGGSNSSSSSGGYFKFIKDLEPNQKNINTPVPFFRELPLFDLFLVCFSPENQRKSMHSCVVQKRHPDEFQ